MGKAKYPLNRFVFYLANYADIDPNQVHRLVDLVDDGYCVEKIDARKHNEVADMFGIKSDVSIRVYDFDKIRTHYKMKGDVKVHSHGTCHISFTDGDKRVNIDRSQLINFLKDENRPRVIYSLDLLAEYNDVDDKMWICLGSFFLNDKGIEFEEKDLLLMPYSQIKVVEQIFPIKLLNEHTNPDETYFAVSYEKVY